MFHWDQGYIHHIPACSQYEDGDEVVLWMSTVGPYHNRQETYSYYSLPFCTGAKNVISHYHETLSEALQGIELKFSGLDIQFKGEYIFMINTHINNYARAVL